MNKHITIGDKVYEVTSQYDEKEELLFEVKEEEEGFTYVVGFWKDLLGARVRRIWGIVGISDKK